MIVYKYSHITTITRHFLIKSDSEEAAYAKIAVGPIEKVREKENVLEQDDLCTQEIDITLKSITTEGTFGPHIV